ncbi:MAG TPA: hypothetical protein VFU97_23645 [Xanthobacteraceae bacterium]|nr:hypothetical protein [Xanthobacteraceae bacterium]
MATITRGTLKTPRAAAIAGIVFSVLLIVIVALLRVTVPADPAETGAWLATGPRNVALALNLVPFAGIAFLWFIGVLRDRLGQREDRFFATVFFGSGLLFLAMLFVAAAIIGAIVLAFATTPGEAGQSATFHVARAFAYDVANIYALKMAAVFMFSTSTVALSTRLTPRWMAVLGYVLAVILLLGGASVQWSIMLLPTWVLLVSVYILIDNFRRSDMASETMEAADR